MKVGTKIHKGNRITRCPQNPHALLITLLLTSVRQANASLQRSTTAETHRFISWSSLNFFPILCQVLSGEHEQHVPYAAQKPGCSKRKACSRLKAADLQKGTQQKQSISSNIDFKTYFI